MIIVQALYFLKSHKVPKVNLFINNINPSSLHSQVSELMFDMRDIAHKIFSQRWLLVSDASQTLISKLPIQLNNYIRRTVFNTP